jgi:Calcineurin-like phosphoesterase
MTKNLIGPQGRLYADPAPAPDETKFMEDNNSATYYSSAYYKAHEKQVQPIPPRYSNQPMNLADYAPAEVMAAIGQAKKIIFHAVGDTGAAKVTRSQTAATAIGHEAAVADAMAKDVQDGGFGGPAFFFHLGDVVYDFGEALYYYDQFFEPFRAYDRPIFAIPGNHDGMVFGPSSTAPKVPTLAAFQTNFCATKIGLSPDSGALMRSVMTQPGVYFTLDAPYVSIIGLYSNVLDSGAGVISSQGGHFPITDEQLDFLKGELTRIKPERETYKRAVIIAVHHPPVSADAKHGGSTGLTKDIDDCCKAAGLWPDMILSGHAHLYQRFTRNVNGRETPYIVSGSGGYAATQPKPIKAGTKVGDHTLVTAPIVDFGYLTIETDAQTLTATFKTAGKGGVVTQRDLVTVDLKKGKISQSVTAPARPAGNTAPAKRGSKTAPQSATPQARRASNTGPAKRGSKTMAKKKSKPKKRP